MNRYCLRNYSFARTTRAQVWLGDSYERVAAVEQQEK